MSTTGDPVQFVRVVHTPATYATWRRAARADAERDRPDAAVRAMAADAVDDEAGRSTGVHQPSSSPRDLYVAPQVDMFSAEVAREAALAAMIAVYFADSPTPCRSPRRSSP